MERVYTVGEIDTVARELLAAYGAPAEAHAVIWALQGDLGAGKTALAQAIARELGVTEAVTSPTFILEKVYELEGKPFKHLVHIDAYRFDEPDEAKVLGWGELISARENLIVLEWPERMGELLPGHTHYFELAIVDETTRRIRYGKNF